MILLKQTTEEYQMDKYNVVLINAIKDDFGSWEWNDASCVSTSFEVNSEKDLTNRNILKQLRERNILGDYTKGKMAVEHHDYGITILDRNTQKPIFELSPIEF